MSISGQGRRVHIVCRANLCTTDIAVRCYGVRVFGSLVGSAPSVYAGRLTAKVLVARIKRRQARQVARVSPGVRLSSRAECAERAN